MTERFTKEWIAEVRRTGYLSRPILTNDRLDEIERLQARVQELEYTLKNKLFEGSIDKENMTKRIAELEQERRWIPVSERLPDCSDRVLVRMSNYYTVIASYFINPEYWKNDAGSKVLNVTHWQPLPQPPQEEE
ncbi:DUF551 domain-containing protein [Candidatus Dojkabacteria bacterium]|nr:DUF551 domain-containing protein [Candidatus Dojkabacteria bacterium]